MSVYSENYKKVLAGYVKILNSIDSLTHSGQLACIPNMLNSWVDLVDMYCTEVAHDKTSVHRKRNADKLCTAAKEMFDDLKGFFQFRSGELAPEEYTGVFKNVRVKPLNEFEYDN